MSYDEELFPFLEPEDEDPSDDEADADKEPNQTCNHCGDSQCLGDCYAAFGVNTP